MIIGAVGDRHRAMALNWSMAASQGSGALTPLWAGALLAAGSASLIFFLAAAAALVHITAYGLLMRRYDWHRYKVPAERTPETHAGISLHTGSPVRAEPEVRKR